MNNERTTEVVDKKEVNTLLIEKTQKPKELSKEVVAMLLDDDADRY